MFSQVVELTKHSKAYFKNKYHRRIFLDSSIVTSCLLFTLCAIVTSQQYFGKPIECMQHSQEDKDKKIPDNIINNFCFISVTYTTVEFKSYKVNSAKVHSFYPWVPLILLLQGLSFLLPRNVWAYMDGGFFEKCLTDTNLLVADNQKMQILGRYLAKRMSSFRIWSLGYIASEFIYVITVLLNFYLTDIFLGGNFLKYGFQVLYEKKSVGSTLFPSMTSCTFYKYGPSGTVENKDALCVMTLNILNEKFYLFLWFWFLLLLLISAMLLLYRLFFLITIMMRNNCTGLIRVMLTSSLGCTGVYVLIRKLSVTDWIFIQQLKRSMHSASYTKLLENIVLEINEPYNLALRRRKGHQVISKALSSHSNSNV